MMSTLTPIPYSNSRNKWTRIELTSELLRLSQAGKRRIYAVRITKRMAGLLSITRAGNLVEIIWFISLLAQISEGILIRIKYPTEKVYKSQALVSKALILDLRKEKLLIQMELDTPKQRNSVRTVKPS